MPKATIRTNTAVNTVSRYFRAGLRAPSSAGERRVFVHDSGSGEARPAWYTLPMPSFVATDRLLDGDAPPPRTQRTVAVLTLGCKLNQAESEMMARELRRAGCTVIDRPATADAYIINSCSVTHIADRKTRHLVRLARRLAPGATVALTGCYPETAGPEAAAAVDADLVVPSRDKAEAVRRLLALRNDERETMNAELEHIPNSSFPHAGRMRAFVKAQEGCNDVCAFCIVPRTRGRERSWTPAQVAEVVREREAEGAHEAVITGTQLGAYGRDGDGSSPGPAALIRTLLAETSVARIRFSSLQPQDITGELLALWEDPRLCRHFHLALQSGSGAVLRRMRRRYTKDDFRAALAAIREVVPDVAVTTDLLVGFPGESEAEHAESLAYCAEAGFAQMHVFPYSRRPGTSADLLPDQIDAAVKRERMAAMLAVASGSATAFRVERLGRTEAVLWEGPVSPPDETGARLWEGLTDTYVRVRTRSRAALRNRLLAVRVTADDGDALRGVLTDDAGDDER